MPAELKTYSTHVPFGGTTTNIVVNGLTNDKLVKVMPILNDVVLGIPMPAPVVVPSPYTPDVELVRTTITQAYMAVKAGLASNPNKINMIKLLRTIIPGIGLKDAKDFVDGCEASAAYVVPKPAPVPSSTKETFGKFLTAMFDTPAFNNIPADIVKTNLVRVLDISVSAADDLYWDNYHPPVYSEDSEAA